MRMTVSEAKKHVIGPAIRQHGKGRTAPRRNSDELKSLGIGPQELPQLASRIQSLLQQHGWSIDLKHLKTIRPNTRVGELTRVVADHSTVSAPKEIGRASCRKECR